VGEVATLGPQAAEQPPLVLPPLREDLRLYAGSAQRDGSPSWRILDPVRNAFFEIGWLEFELIARWKESRDGATLAARVAAETSLRPTLEEVKDLLDFLTTNQLLAAGNAHVRQALATRVRMAEKQGWFEQLLHTYLFFRVPLLRPDAFLARALPFTDVFFTRGFVFLVVALLGLDLYLISREWYVFTDALGRIFTPQAFLPYAIAVTFSKIVHELAHAFAARRYGVRVPTLGVAFLVLWPYLYTDTGETWKLGDRRKQLVIACAGMGAELVLAVFSTVLWALSPEGAAKNVFFVLASSTWVMTLAINLSPFMRFDGYFVVSDLLDFPNLHERATACAKWWLRRTFFGLDSPMPESHLKPLQRAGLIVFAYITWLYRLTVFIGIALLVYHFAFKLLGIFLFLLEIVWFIIAPVWRETAFLWTARSAMRLAAAPLVSALGVVAALVWIFPYAHQVTAPAVFRAEQENAVYAPFAGRVTAIRVADRQSVAADAELLTVEPADLDSRDRKADIGIASARAELARMPASRTQQENYQVLQQRLAQALAEKQAVAEEGARKVLRAAQGGVVRDVAPDLVEGRWINTKQLLMRVVSGSEQVIEAYVSEQQVAAIHPGQVVRFYPRMPDRPVLSGEVVAVDKSPQKELARPLLASIHGGDINVKQGNHGALVAQDAIFRVTVKPRGAVLKGDAVMQGSVRIETEFTFQVENFVYRILSVLIRESGL
jgi:putative peptide zinc metalloprotease protein